MYFFIDKTTLKQQSLLHRDTMELNPINADNSADQSDSDDGDNPAIALLEENYIQDRQMTTVCMCNSIQQHLRISKYIVRATISIMSVSMVAWLVLFITTMVTLAGYRNDDRNVNICNANNTVLLEDVINSVTTITTIDLIIGSIVTVFTGMLLMFTSTISMCKTGRDFASDHNSTLIKREDFDRVFFMEFRRHGITYYKTIDKKKIIKLVNGDE